MFGISALNFDIIQKLDIFSKYDRIGFIEYGVDSLSDLKVLEKNLEPYQGSVQMAFHLPLKLNALEDIDELRKSNFNYIKSIIEEGLKFKPLYFNMHLGYAFSGKYDNSRKKFNDMCADYIRDILSIDKSVKLYLENVYTSNKTGGCDLFAVGVNEDQFVPLFKDLPSDKVGFCLDLGHHMIQKEPLEDPVLYENCILHFNLNDEEQDIHLGLRPEAGFDESFFDKLINSRDFKHIVLELPLDELIITVQVLKKMRYENE